MKNRDKTIGECCEELRKSLLEMKRQTLWGVANKLEERLTRLKREAIAAAEMEKARELSVCEAMATVIKRLAESAEGEEQCRI